MIVTSDSYNPYADERHVGCLITVGERSFNADSVKSIKLKYSASHTSESLPGSELTFEVENSADVSSFFEGLDTDTEIAVSLIIDGESVNMGTFLYSTISYKESDLVAQVTGRDYMEALDDLYTTDLGSWSTLSGAVSTLLPGVTVEYGESLSSTPVVRGYEPGTSKREALRLLAQAACCSCWYTRDKKLRFASMAADWQGVDTINSDRLRSWDMLSVEDPVAQVNLTANILEKYFYFDNNDYLEENRSLGSATIPANSTGYVYFDKPGEMLYVNGYDASDMTASGWWAQLGVQLLESSIYGIKVKTPRGLIWETDPWKIYIQGNEYGVTATEYSSGSGSPAKDLSNSCVPSDRAAAVAAWLKKQLDRRETYSVEYRCNPAIEVGDTVLIYKKDGTSTLASVTDISIDYDGGLKSTMTCVKKSDGKEPGDLTISPSLLTLNSDTPTGVVTVNRAGDGAISAVSSNTAVATVSVSGTEITVTSTGKGGTATVTVSVAESTYHLAPADVTCRVICNFTPVNFADADWGEIIAACQSGSIPSTWSVGDSNTMTIDGTAYQVDIIGKAHDTYADGSGTAPLTFQLHDIVQTSRFNAKYLSPNHKLWSECDLRTETLPAILAKMPSEVQAAVRAVSKVSMSDWAALNSGKYKASTYSDTLFLLSTVELEGANATYTDPAEGTQYAYYKAGNSKIKKYNGTATAWWTRSATPIASTNWYGARYTTATGSTGSSDAANVSHGVVPAWCF